MREDLQSNPEAHWTGLRVDSWRHSRYTGVVWINVVAYCIDETASLAMIAKLSI